MYQVIEDFPQLGTSDSTQESAYLIQTEDVYIGYLFDIQSKDKYTTATGTIENSESLTIIHGTIQYTDRAVYELVFWFGLIIFFATLFNSAWLSALGLLGFVCNTNYLCGIRI